MNSEQFFVLADPELSDPTTQSACTSAYLSKGSVSMIYLSVSFLRIPERAPESAMMLIKLGTNIRSMNDRDLGSLPAT